MLHRVSSPGVKTEYFISRCHAKEPFLFISPSCLREKKGDRVNVFYEGLLVLNTYLARVRLHALRFLNKQNYTSGRVGVGEATGPP